MAVYHPHTVTCACGNALIVQLATSVNAGRSPQVREQILKEELHRVACSACGRKITVEKPFYYTDLPRNTFFRVLPRGERHCWRRASAELDRAVEFFGEGFSPAEGRTLRVVFGMDELREKLVMQDAGFDDRLVELLKVLLIYEHPILLRRARLRLVLHAVTAEALEFIAAYEHHSQRFRVRMPRPLAEELAADPGKMVDWARRAHPTSSLFDLPDHWVNLWRWSPQPPALEQLRAYAQELSAGKDVDTASPAFQQMLQGLPRGNHLPRWAKQDLRTLFEYAKRQDDQRLQDALFELRFGIELEDDWSSNQDRDDIDTLWQLLRDLPDTHVEGNTRLDEILLIDDSGGWYDPSTHDIAIGAGLLSDRESFEDVMRHEVGHAVYEMHKAEADAWLETRFGWATFSPYNKAQVDRWVDLMGGWGPLTPQQQAEVQSYLQIACGSSQSWDPGSAPWVPPGHPWHADDFGPRLAFERSESKWYRTYPQWYRANGKAFFLNYWYATLVAVDESTLDLVAQLPDDYAAMSHFEFFAELYALYYDPDDPRWNVVPQEVRDWFDQHAGAPEAESPRPAPPDDGEPWENTIRPDY